MSEARVDQPRHLEVGFQAVHPPTRTNGSASTLPMSDDEKTAAAEREETKVIGFAPVEEESGDA